MEVVCATVQQGEQKHLRIIVSDIVEEAWRRLEVNRLVKEVINGDEEIRLRVERLLSAKRVEEKELLDAVERGEAREKRLNRIMMIKLIWEKKLAAKNIRKMYRMLEQLSLEDLEMEIDDIELKAIDMMELEEPNDPVDMM